MVITNNRTSHIQYCQSIVHVHDIKQPENTGGQLRWKELTFFYIYLCSKHHPLKGYSYVISLIS